MRLLIKQNLKIFVYMISLVSILHASYSKQRKLTVLTDCSLTVKAVTLIFISGCGSAIPFAKEGKSGFFLFFGKELIRVLSRANVRSFHENPNRIHTELTFINP